MAKMALSNKAYDTLKWIAQYVLPALGALYFTLSSIWGLPYGEQVLGTITALDMFLGVILGVSTRSYKRLGVDTTKDGQLLIDSSDPNKDIYRLDVGNLDDLASKDQIVLKVQPVQNLSAPK